MPDGVRYPYRENAYQAYKIQDADLRVQLGFTTMTPGSAKRSGRKLVLRFGWELWLSTEVMRTVVLSAFWQNPDLRQNLLETGYRELVEGNTWGDVTWGAVRQGDQWFGENRLGRILMCTREILRGPIRPVTEGERG